MTSLRKSLDKFAKTIPDEMEGAFVELSIEGDQEEQSVALAFEKKKGKFSLVSSIGLTRIDKEIDYKIKFNIRYGW